VKRKHLILFGEIRLDVCKEEGAVFWVEEALQSEVGMEEEGIAIKVIL
jgi:hypothetical protein